MNEAMGDKNISTNRKKLSAPEPTAISVVE